MHQIKPIVDRILGSSEKVSDELLYFCPKCSHRKRKLSVNYEKDKFKCWICEYSGKSIFTLIRNYGSYEDIKEYKSYIEKISISSIHELVFGKKQEDKKVITTCSLPDEYEFILYSDHKVAKKAVSYLISRGISEEDMYKWKIGFCESGNCALRIIFPSFNSSGNCNFYIARGFLEDTKYKYLYPKIEKSRIIFNEININWNEPVYITEGIIDAIKIGKNCIPLIGKTLAVDDNGYCKLIEKLFVYQPKIYLCLDSDRVKNGVINRSVKLAEKLIEFGIHNIEIIDPYPYSDFGEIPKEKISMFLNKKENVVDKFDIVEKQIQMMRVS